MFFNLSILTFWTGSFPFVGPPCALQVFCSSPGLHPPGASSSPPTLGVTTQMSSGIATCPWERG